MCVSVVLIRFEVEAKRSCCNRKCPAAVTAVLTGSVLGRVVRVSVYYPWVKSQVGSAFSKPVWRHLESSSEQIRPSNAFFMLHLLSSLKEGGGGVRKGDGETDRQTESGGAPAGSGARMHHKVVRHYFQSCQ